MAEIKTCPKCHKLITIFSRDTIYETMTCPMCGETLYIHSMDSQDDCGGAFWYYLSLEKEEFDE